MQEKSKKIWESLNPLGSCKKYKVPFWRCPTFLFFVMGLIIIASIFITYYVATSRINNPGIVNLIVLVIAAILIIIDFIITKSFERVFEANRMKTEFIGIISHQLRSPLTNLKFSLEILIDDTSNKISGEEAEYYTALKENIEKMNSLIDKLLLVSRIETEGLTGKRQQFSLKELVEKIVLKFEDFTKASNVNILLDIEKDLPKVFADPFWIEQVVRNLLDNAIKYTKEKGEIKIAVLSKSKRVFFRIEDNGVGIPKEEQRYIFQKFFRSKNALKKETHGTGLGLYIVKEVLKSAKGKIWFKSRENKGTTFYFTLPAAKAGMKTKV